MAIAVSGLDGACLVKAAEMQSAMVRAALRRPAIAALLRSRTRRSLRCALDCLSLAARAVTTIRGLQGEYRLRR